MDAPDRRRLEVLQDFFQQHHHLPSFAAAARLFGMKSTSGVARMVGRLKAEGYLEPSRTGRLTPGKKFFERPVLRSPGDEQAAAKGDAALHQVVSIDQVLIKAPSRTVLLKVKDDSMGGAGLLPGDWVVVQRGAPALPGQIVVAVVDNEFTIRYLETSDSQEFVLRAANPAYPAVGQEAQFELFGRVMGAYRTY